jgi:AbrB family looped-hinge helix DNA binding protein
MVKTTLSSTISSKGQVTVPLEIRKRLGLKEGDRIEFVITDDRTFIRPAQLPANPFRKYIGRLPSLKDKGEINRWVARLRDSK